MRLKELRAELRRRGLRQAGTKREMIQRLEANDKAPAPAPAPAPTSVPPAPVALAPDPIPPVAVAEPM